LGDLLVKTSCHTNALIAVTGIQAIGKMKSNIGVIKNGEGPKEIMTYCPVHGCTMMNDSICNARLAELELYERKGIRGGIVLGNELSRYEEFLKCRVCKGGDATPQKLVKRKSGKNGGRPKTFKRV
jgi:hypothetical protein